MIQVLSKIIYPLIHINRYFCKNKVKNKVKITLFFVGIKSEKRYSKDRLKVYKINSLEMRIPKCEM